MTAPNETALPFEIVEERFQDVKSRIAGCGVDPNTVKIVAVTGTGVTLRCVTRQ